MTNLFGWRATSPEDLKTAPDPIGPDNARHLVEAVAECLITVLAWGNHGSLFDRDKSVLKLLDPWRHKLHAIRLNRKTGQPAHPLYIQIGLYPLPLEEATRG